LLLVAEVVALTAAVVGVAADITPEVGLPLRLRLMQLQLDQVVRLAQVILGAVVMVGHHHLTAFLLLVVGEVDPVVAIMLAGELVTMAVLVAEVVVQKVEFLILGELEFQGREITADQVLELVLI
jgi:hypothetical protein